MENGYCRMPDGSFFVAVRTEFPNATDKMFDWWFEWHAKNLFGIAFGIQNVILI